jgi:capsid portal protein
VDEISSEHIDKAHEIVVSGFQIAGTSTQKPPPSELITPENALEPPVPLDALAKLSQLNGLRSSIIEAIARNTVGLGHQIEVWQGYERDVTDPRAKGQEVCNLLDALTSRDLRMDHPSFTELMVAVKTDEEEVGWGFIEVSRNMTTGQIDGLFHVPGKLMRRLKDRSGYVLLNPYDLTKSVEFYNFGEKVEYDDADRPTATLASGKSWSVNEVLGFKLYTSESRDYGLPRDVALALEYAGDKLAAEYNVSFFDSGGTPPTLLFIRASGEDELGARVSFKVPQQTVQRIANTIKSDTGHRERVAIIPLPANSAVDRITLGEVSDRDMGFVNYRNDNTQRVLSAFRMQPIFVGMQSEGRYDAEVQRSITLEQLFDPEQARYEAKLRTTLLKDLGYEEFTIAFKRMAVESDAARRDGALALAQGAAITLREYRAAHGYPPLPEAPAGQDPQPGQYPTGINDRLVDITGARGGGTGSGSGTRPPAQNNNVALEPRQDQRGLQPGLAGRQQQSTPNELATQRQKQNGAGAVA